MGNSAKKTAAAAAPTQPPRNKNIPHHYFLNLGVIGAPNSGKSTFAKQMRILYDNGFTDEEKQTYKMVLISNILLAIKELIAQSKSKGIAIENEEAAKILTEIDPDRVALTPELVGNVKNLWESSLKQVYSRRSEFVNVPSTMEYCMTIIDRLADPEYTLTNYDILHARTGTIETTGVKQGRFTYCLEHVPSVQHIHENNNFVGIVFFVALDEWDVMSEEDPTKTRLQKILEEVERAASEKSTRGTPMMLILNKKDAFKEKIMWNDLSRAFPEYKGGSDYNKAIEFIKNLFLARMPQPGTRPCYGTDPVPNIHITCALDTQEMKNLFDALKEYIFKMSVTPG